MHTKEATVFCKIINLRSGFPSKTQLLNAAKYITRPNRITNIYFKPRMIISPQGIKNTSFTALCKSNQS